MKLADSVNPVGHQDLVKIGTQKIGKLIYFNNVSIATAKIPKAKNKLIFPCLDSLFSLFSAISAVLAIASLSAWFVNVPITHHKHNLGFTCIYAVSFGFGVNDLCTKKEKIGYQATIRQIAIPAPTTTITGSANEAPFNDPVLDTFWSVCTSSIAEFVSSSCLMVVPVLGSVLSSCVIAVSTAKPPIIAYRKSPKAVISTEKMGIIFSSIVVTYQPIIDKVATLSSFQSNGMVN